MKAMHFVCAPGPGNELPKNVTFVGGHIYTSGFWFLKPEVAQELVGGLIFLHQTKKSPAYFAGRVTKFERVNRPESKRPRRILFHLTLAPELKGQEWRGKDHSNAWNSGILET